MNKITEYSLKYKVKEFPCHLFFWVSYASLRVFMTAEYIIKYDLVSVVDKVLRTYLVCIIVFALFNIIIPDKYGPAVADIVIIFSILYLLWTYGLMRDNVGAKNVIDIYEREHGKIRTILCGGKYGTI